MIAADQFGVEQAKGRTEGERQQQNQRDCGQPSIGDQLRTVLSGRLFRAVFAGVQEAMFQRPILS